MSQLIYATNPCAYRKEFVLPLHDTGGTLTQISIGNENFDPVRISRSTGSGMTRSGMKF